MINNRRKSGLERRNKRTPIQDKDKNKDQRNSRERRSKSTSIQLIKKTPLVPWVFRHLQVFFYTLGQICRQPFASLMTAAVIGIALALPTGFYVLLKNVQQVSSSMDDVTQISLFLKKEINEKQAQELSSRLQKMPEVESIQHISPQEALEEFRQYAGFSTALKVLDENPLPSVLVIDPIDRFATPEVIGSLLEQLEIIPEVEIVRLDMQWIKRLNALLETSQRGVLILATLLAMSVPLIVGNTIRLAINNRRDEIEITKLIGATDAFIRRPFLYSGLWYGLLGGIIAWLLITGSLGLLSAPVERLSLLYDSTFILHALDFSTSFKLLAISALLGWLGSWLAVGRHLREIEPS